MEERIRREPADRSQMEHAVEAVFQKEFLYCSPKDPMPTEEQIRQILRTTNKWPEDEVKPWSLGGYPTCREKAIAVFQHKAEKMHVHSQAHEKRNPCLICNGNFLPHCAHCRPICDFRVFRCGREIFWESTRSECLRCICMNLLIRWIYRVYSDTHQNIHGKWSAILGVPFVHTPEHCIHRKGKMQSCYLLLISPVRRNWLREITEGEEAGNY